MSAKFRGFVFTINNWSDDDATLCMSLQETAQYLVVGKETGESGTPHLQGYVYFKSQRTFKSLKKMLPRAHIEVAKGTAQHNRTYCTKDGDILIEHGTPPVQGSRTDIMNAMETAMQTLTMREVVATTESYQAVRIAQLRIQYFEPKRDWKPEVRWYHGSTGSGKTRAAREWLGPDCYTCMGTAKWWQDYDGHEAVLIDDYRKDFCKFHELLKLLDRYEYRVECKGGSRQLRAKFIAITAPYHPADMYDGREDVQQLIRRIDEIILIGDYVKKCVHTVQTLTSKNGTLF